MTENDVTTKHVRYFQKPAIQPMVDWSESTDMTGVSVSDADVANGSPRAGDMIAFNANDLSDQWLVSAAYMAENYVEVDLDGVDAVHVEDGAEAGCTEACSGNTHETSADECTGETTPE